MAKRQPTAKAEAAVTAIENDIARILTGRDGLLQFFVAIHLLEQHGIIDDNTYTRMLAAHDDALEAIRIGQRYARQVRALTQEGKTEE